MGDSRGRDWGAFCWWMPFSSASGRGRSWVCGCCCSMWRALLVMQNALASTASTHRWGFGPCQDDRSGCVSLWVLFHLRNRADQHQRGRCFLLQPVIVDATFSRCHCRGPRPLVQPQRRSSMPGVCTPRPLARDRCRRCLRLQPQAAPTHHEHPGRFQPYRLILQAH